MDIDLLLSEALKKLRKKNFEEALNDFDKIIEIDPNVGEAYFGRAKCYESMLEGKITKEIPGWKGIPVLTAVLPEDDWRLGETIKSYEKAVELLPKDRNVFENALNFFTSGPDLILSWEVGDRILDKWLRHNPDDISAWCKRAMNAKWGFKANDQKKTDESAIKSYKKVFDLIELVYECKDFCYDDFGRTTQVIKFPNKMVKEHNEILNDALTELLILFAEEKNYEEMFKYFWKLFWISDNKAEKMRFLTTLFLSEEKVRERSDDRLNFLRQRQELNNEQGKRKTLQNELVDICFHQIKGFLRTNMENKHGKTWWEDRVPDDVKKRGSERKNIENKHPDKPKKHEFEYLDLRDYQRIMKANWDIFKENFKSREFVEHEIIDLLSHLRNEVKHNSRLLEDREIKELEIILGKIEKCTGP